ncbi:crotonase/enoyl-CoA hydratase family protein [Candidatus Phycosocius spiralis]|uniref:Enoyl-CoA hydratase n=1 Tax=Candidatus Phycosocius spiralis TaxID=2815099 RepID=A0ABQ4PTZ7_9PROT|nr:crotonase/enoyl-CoA hydratase family protein [Candidatus Phycosocius spiralis]GIU66198.1 enoyl-CoA hydratase [Candidatus Phycosocius spiralis]
MSASLTIDHEVAIVRMDDGKANVINLAMIEALHWTLDEAEAKAKAIVLAGREGRFSGGFDLLALTGSGQEAAVQLLVQGGQLLVRLYGSPLPVVAACTGHAIAMGVFLLHACDTRFGAAGPYKIGANETTNGMVLPTFAIELSRDRLNPSHMTKALIQAFIYDPEGAVAAGYIDHVVPLDQVETQAFEHARHLAQLPGHAYHGNKLAIRGATLERIKASLASHRL